MMAVRFLQRLREYAFGWVADLRNGDLNPILVRELRQYIRSRFATLIVVLMLIGLLLIAIGFLGSNEGSVDLSGTGVSEGNGGQMYVAVFLVLGIASALVALTTTLRLGRERDKRSPDLLFTTTLSPGSIVRGKFLAGLAMFGLLFSLAMPFMTTTYLLRGIDVPTILWGLAGLLLGNVVLMALAVLLGCMPLGPLFRWGGVLIGIVAFWFAFALLNFAFRSSTALGFATMGAWSSGMASGSLVTTALIVSFSFATAILILSPRYSNRFLPYRLTLTGMWGLGLWLAWRHPGHVEIWVVPSALFLLFMVQVGECTQDHSDGRVLRHAPRLLPLRVLLFPFYSGGSSGVLWALGLLGATFWVAIARTPTPTDFWQFLVIIVYVACYILTAGFISRRLPIHTQEGAAVPWLITLYFLATAAMVPPFIELLHETEKIKFELTKEYGNAFAMFRNQEDLWEEHLWVAAIWLGVMLLLNLPRFIRAFRDFRRPEEALPPTLEALVEAEGPPDPLAFSDEREADTAQA
jgi:hypothetical protein